MFAMAKEGRLSNLAIPFMNGLVGVVHQLTTGAEMAGNVGGQ